MSIPTVGIDPDTSRLAVAHVADGRVTLVRTIARVNTRGLMSPLYDPELAWLMRYAATNDIAVYVEGTFLPGGAVGATKANVETHAALCRVQGELLHAARLAGGVRVVVVSANEWRAGSHGVLKPRDACKDAAARFVRRIGYTGWDLSDHENEAICIAWYGDGKERRRLCERRAVGGTAAKGGKA